jgi:hypothetical protein
MKKITKPAVILLSFATALIYVPAFTTYAIKSVMAPANWFDSKKESIISCGPNASTRSGTLLKREGRGEEWDNGHESSNRKRGAKNNEGNGCSHQQTSGFLCEVSSEKRRNQKAHDC